MVTFVYRQHMRSLGAKEFDKQAVSSLWVYIELLLLQ